MAAQDKVLLGTGPDTSGSEVLYDGFTKVNGNIDLLLASGIGDSGASQIGFDDDGVSFTATDVQAAIEEITIGTGEVNTASNLGATVGREGVWADKNVDDLRFKSLVAGAGISLNSSATEITITNDGAASAALNVVYKKFVDLPYTVGASVDVVIFDTEAIQNSAIDLPAGSEGRVINIKSRLDSTQTYDLTIDANGAEKIEDDASGQLVSSITIGPGSNIKLAYSAASPAAWWIV